MARWIGLYTPNNFPSQWMINLEAMVGIDGQNRREDVLIVQFFLESFRRKGNYGGPFFQDEVKRDGLYGPVTNLAIDMFQLYIQQNRQPPLQADRKIAPISASGTWIMSTLAWLQKCYIENEPATWPNIFMNPAYPAYTRFDDLFL